MSVLFLKYLYVLPAAGAAVFTQPAAILIPVITPAAAAHNAALAFRHRERGKDRFLNVRPEPHGCHPDRLCLARIVEIPKPDFICRNHQHFFLNE